MAADLNTMLAVARLRLLDFGMRNYPEALLVAAANEGKNEIVKIIRQAQENFFVTSTTGTIGIAAAPNPSVITLPSLFSELRDFMVTDSGYEDIQFEPMSPSDARWKRALIDGGSYGSGSATCYYWLYGNSRMELAPGFDMALAYKMYYVSMIADFGQRESWPDGLPLDCYDWLVTWMVCDALRTKDEGGRLAAWEKKLDYQRESIIQSVNTRQNRDPIFVRGYGEEEMW